MGYEVSVGVSESTDRQTLNETVNQAETAMRHDKMEFYRNNGGIRQMRIIDDKLEQLLIKKQDVIPFSAGDRTALQESVHGQYQAGYLSVYLCSVIF